MGPESGWSDRRGVWPLGGYYSRWLHPTGGGQKHSPEEWWPLSYRYLLVHLPTSALVVETVGVPTEHGMAEGSTRLVSATPGTPELIVLNPGVPYSSPPWALAGLTASALCATRSLAPHTRLAPNSTVDVTLTDGRNRGAPSGHVTGVGVWYGQYPPQRRRARGY